MLQDVTSLGKLKIVKRMSGFSILRRAHSVRKTQYRWMYICEKCNNVLQNVTPMLQIVTSVCNTQDCETSVCNTQDCVTNTWVTYRLGRAYHVLFNTIARSKLYKRKNARIQTANAQTCNTAIRHVHAQPKTQHTRNKHAWKHKE